MLFLWAKDIMNTEFKRWLADQNPGLKGISEKILENRRISAEEGLCLFSAPLGLLALLANARNEVLQGNQVFYVRNFHVEPTNTCAYHCLFCSYSGVAGLRDNWELSLAGIQEIIEQSDPGAVEIHITGGAHPRWKLEDYCQMLRLVRSLRPDIHIKAFSAVEIHHLHKTSGLPYGDVLNALKTAGLNALPGGGAEIFNPEIRNRICPEKANAEQWLEIHRTAHRMSLPSNATMLYGHIESYADRIDHMEKLRRLQDETGGFNAFIPLKFRNAFNKMSDVPEVSIVEDMKNYAVSRIFLDNFPHLKAYWPMLGKQSAGWALEFGVDDLDGTIQDSTKIYTMAGVEEKPVMSASEMQQMILHAGKIPVERDALYHPVEPG